jgi:cysteine desulfurase
LASLEEKGLDFQVLSPEGAVPHILNLAFTGLKGETLVNALSAEGVYISAGSACSARRPQSRILPAMGYSQARVEQAVRISFSAQNTENEIDQAAAAIARALQRYSL